MYRSAFRKYSAYTKKNATQLIDEALEDQKRDERIKQDVVLNNLVGFYNYLKNDYAVKSRGNTEHVELRKGLSDKTCITDVAAIRSFYATYNINIRMKGRTGLPKPKVANKRMIVSAEQVRTLINHVRTPRDRAIILMLFQAGLDVSTLCSLTYGDVVEGLSKNETPLKLEPQRVKTGVEFYTFLGKDAVEALKAYIKDAESRGVTFSRKSSM